MCKRIFSSKKSAILSFILLLILIIGIVAFILINSNKNNNLEKVNPSTNNNVNIDNDKKGNEKEENNNQEVLNIESNDKNNEIPKNENKDNKDNNKKPNTSNNSKTEENSNSEIIEENKPNNEKVVCSNSDSDFVSFLSTYKTNNPSYFVFDTLSEAKKFGEDAMIKFGYAYEYNDIPEIYNSNTCTKEIWYVRLIIPAKECAIPDTGEYNDKMYIPATSKDNLVNYFDYLRDLGYDCGNKQWFH